MTQGANQPASTEDIKAVTIELETYRQRLIDDIIQMGKKIKMSKKKVEQHINNHPEIQKIDLVLEQLRSQAE